MFNAEEILNQQIEGSNDTEVIQVPNGEYPAVITKVDVRTPKESVILDITWEIDDRDGSVQEHTGREKNTVRQSIFLDITESGGLDMGKGKNAQLGRLRESVGCNEGTFTFNDLVGKVALVRTEQRLYEGRTFVDVKGVAPIE